MEGDERVAVSTSKHTQTYKLAELAKFDECVCIYKSRLDTIR